MPDAARIAVSVVCAEPGRVFTADLRLRKGATVADAIERSGIRASRSDIAIHDDRLGIFSRKVAPATELRDGDRVEIYRPLLVDPKEARRKRARGG